MKGKLEERIRHTRLTKTETRIADCLLENREKLYFMTAKDIALSLGVSDTSVIRLCRSLGYRGYRDLQDGLRQELSAALEKERYVIPWEQAEKKLGRRSSPSPYVYLENAEKVLRSTYNKNEAGKFKAAAELLLKSQHIYVAGFRGSAGTVDFLTTLLSQFVPKVTGLSRADSSCVETLADLEREDCLVLLCAERYSKMAIVLAEMAAEAGCRLIVICDKMTAPPAAGADLVLLADISSPNAVNSYLGMVFVAESIAFEVAQLLGSRASRRLARIDKYLSQLELY